MAGLAGFAGSPGSVGLGGPFCDAPLPFAAVAFLPAELESFCWRGIAMAEVAQAIARIVATKHCRRFRMRPLPSGNLASEGNAVICFSMILEMRLTTDYDNLLLLMKCIFEDGE